MFFWETTKVSKKIIVSDFIIMILIIKLNEANHWGN